MMQSPRVFSFPQTLSEYHEFMRRVRVGARTITAGPAGYCPTCGRLLQDHSGGVVVPLHGPRDDQGPAA